MRNFKRVISMFLAVCMLLSVLPLSAFALTITEKPGNETTAGQPFPTGTAGSTNFRIPGIVTLNDGTLIAISDARWSTNVDAGGLDTIVSVSTDNGANWTYTFANYLGDNGDVYNARSSCFIDPAIATDGTTAYLIADLFPAGVTTYNVLYAAQSGSTGYDDNGNLLLRSDSELGLNFGDTGYAASAATAAYNYYLNLETLKLYAYGADGAEDTLVEGYTVDAYFNIVSDDGTVDTNLFFEDSPYKPFPTNYLYMTTSTNGLEWSTPTLLNLKEADETAFLVGPGSGIAVDGRMVYTAYEYNGDVPSQRTCLIWRDADGGWHRSEAATDGTWSSEASVVDLGDGKLRVFYRDGNSYLSYTDFNWSETDNNYVRDTSATSVATAAAKRSGSGCMVSSFKYSKQIEGKDVILVSTPANSDARDNGYLYVFLVDPTDKSMELAYAYDIFPNQDEDYAYSCITEMKDGTIALLYESIEKNPCAITFTTIAMDDVTAYENDARLNFIDVDLYLGETWTHKDTTGNYTLTDYTSDVANVTVSGTTATVPAATTMYSGTAVALADCLYTLTETDNGCYLHHTLSDGTEVYIDAHAGSGNIGYPNRTYTSELTLANSTNTTGAIVITDASGSLHLHKEEEPPRWNQCGSVCGDKHDLLFFRPAASGETESEIFAGFVQVTDVADLEDGVQYLIAAKSDAGDYYVLSPANGGGSKTSNDHLAKVTGDAEISSSVITVEALTEGNTTVQIGSNVYTITVSEIPAVEVEVKEKETVTETVPGAYCASDISGLDTSHATVDLAVSGVTASVALHESLNNSTEVTLEGSEYTFTDAGDGTWYATIESGDSTYYISPYNRGHHATQTALTLTFNADGSVYIKDSRSYLYVNRVTPKCDRVTRVTDAPAECTFYIYGAVEGTDGYIPGYKLITSNEQITSGGKYLIAFYDNNGQLYVMNPATLSTAVYNQMAEVDLDTAAATTTISITGVMEGKTSLILGDDEYKFNITVRDENYDPIAIPSTENVYQGPDITRGQKPDNNTTEGQPFLTGTGGSANFRIPGIVTLTSGEHSGRIIATTDARWTTTLDGGGLDTLVSVSDDNGTNWTYTFANYLGDNGNVANPLSTCIIDPAIGTDGTTAYMIADLFPAGIALNGATYSPVNGNTGFNEDGNLLLRDLAGDTVVIGADGYNTMAAAREYNYYLDLDTYEIRTANGTLCAGFTVDAHFNISYTDAAGTTHSTNLFFADSPFQPYPTDYLYLVASDDGLTWSVPKLLNLKDADEQVLLVGPGNGTYDETTGRMVFTAYRHTGSASGTAYECTCLIWMDENGDWHRTEDATVNFWSSEASVVALADGTLRVFYRDSYNILHYTDFVWSDDANNYVRDPDATEVSTTAVKDDGCQLTAITYSEKIENKDAIIVATPVNPASRRTDGHLYVFLVNDDKTMELAYDYDIVPDTIEAYAYSCITEMEDGNIALLYEGNYAATNGNAEIIFTTIDMDDVTHRDNDARLSFVDVTVLTEESVTVSDSTGYYVDADTSELKPEVATVTMTGSQTVTNAAQILGTGANIDLDACQYTFTASGDYYVVSATAADGTTVYLDHFSTTGNNCPNVTAPGNIAVLAGSVEGMFQLQAQSDGTDSARTLHFHAESSMPYWNRCRNDSTYKCHEYLFRKAADGETESTDIPGYVQITSLDEVVDGGKYLIAAKNDAGNWYVLNPVISTTALDHVAQVMGRITIGNTEVTFTGVGEGYSEVLIGSTVYRVTVKESITEGISVAVGDSITIDTTYTGALTGLDTTYATAELSDGVLTITGVYPGTAYVDLGRTRYNITVTGSVVKVDLTEGETASYVVSSTDADMTQPDSAVASTAFGTGYGAQLGSAQSTYAGEYAALENLLYTFADNGDGTWTVSSTTADGTTVYLEPYAKSNGNGYPNVTSPVAVTLSDGYTDNSVYLQGNGGYLFFWRSSNLYFDRVTSTSGFEAATSFLLYRPAAEGEESSTEIPGYVLVAGASNVTEGKYLIVAQYGSDYYMLYPTLSTAHRSAQIAHLVSDATAVVVTGEGAGETSFRVESTVYEVTVSHNYESVVTAPTCTEGGYTTHTCTVCGDSYVTDETEALGHSFVDGTCTVCGIGVARNTNTGTNYATVAEALAAAQSGETVILLTDVAENRVLVTPGTTLDLNGYTLTANYVVGFNTSAILDSSNSEANGYVPQGLLAVDPDNMVLYEGNGAVPVYNAEKGGYIFVDFLFQAKATSDGDVAQINMLVTSRTLEVIDLLKDGAEDNDIQIVVRLTWDSETGTAYQDFVFNEDTIQNVMKSNTGTYGGFERMFYVNVSGINELTGVTATAMVIAGSNAVDAGKTLNVN